LALSWLAARLGRRAALFTIVGTTPIALGAFAIAPNLGLAAVAIFVLGAAYVGSYASVFTIAQLRAPNNVRGRVTALALLVLGSGYPLGSLLQGWMADRIGLRATMGGAAALLALISLGIRILHPDFDAGVAEPAEEHRGEPVGLAGAGGS